MSDVPAQRRWYAGVTRYQWLVLAVASAGWVFDAFEGQIFNITLKSLPGMGLLLAISLLGLLFQLGAVIVLFLPETKDQPLPE